MASIIHKLTASGGPESVDFLNNIVEQLWPNINVAGSKMTKDIAEPMFASMLPGPLASLTFHKVDFGHVPIRFANVDVHKAENGGIKVDLDLNWDGKCDIELGASLVPKIGVEHVKINGRLTVLLCPLTNVLPLVGAAQVAFINPPSLELDFTNAANIADLSVIDSAIRRIMISIISSILVLPNRILVKLDANSDFFQTYRYQLGVARVTVGKVSGFEKPKGGNFFSNLVKDVPDPYCKVDFGGEGSWKTSTKDNEVNPEWNETRDFIVSDYDQHIVADIQDSDLIGDDDIGLGSTTVKKILLAGGKEELSLSHKGQPVSGKLHLACEFHEFIPDISSFSEADNVAEGRIAGLVTVLVAGASHIPGQREELNPNVKVSWGELPEFRTVIKTDMPGTDISNPAFDSVFRIPVTGAIAASQPDIKISLLNKEEEMGSCLVPFSEILEAPELILVKNFDMGNGASVRASICVRGTKVATIH